MPEGDARQTRLAHVNATILRGEGFLILNTRDVAEHVWQALLHAGARPFGMIAQQQWMEYVMKTHKPEPVMWGRHALKPTYDVAIIGAGVHGLAAAYYLGKIHGIRKVALLEKGYIGCGNSTRNTAILRSNYRTFPGIAFYDASLRLYEGLSRGAGLGTGFQPERAFHAGAH